jgi:predicted RNA-binding Zn-ribbon protein involved in translation (DUF1610 family)
MSEPGYFKIECASCKGHIEFPKEMYWQKISCPHCGLSTVLGVTGKQKQPRTPRELIEVKHIRTSDVETPPPEIDWVRVLPNMNLSPITKDPYWKEYAITNYFLVKCVEWKIRTICSFYTKHIYKATGMPEQYNPQNHKDYNNLVLILADELFNRVVRSKCDDIELGLKNVSFPRLERDELQKQYGIGHFDYHKCGIGHIYRDSSFARKFSYGNTITLTIGNRHSFTPSPEEGYKPYFKLSKHDW